MGTPEYFLKKANEQLKSSKNMFGFITSADKLEDAIENFNKAGNLFKIQKAWEEAGNAYETAGDLTMKFVKKSEFGEIQDAARFYSSAARCYESNPSTNHLCPDMLDKAVKIYEEDGSVSMSARIHQELGEYWYLQKQYPNMIDHLQKSISLYEIEGKGKMHVQKSQEKVAEAYSLYLNQPDEAAQIYEEMGKSYLSQHQHLAHKAHHYFFRSTLCHLANADLVSAKRSLTRFRMASDQFESSRESEYLEYFICCLESYDSEKFHKYVYDYQRLTHYNLSKNSWESTMLQRLEQHLNGDEVHSG